MAGVAHEQKIGGSERAWALGAVQARLRQEWLLPLLLVLLAVIAVGLAYTARPFVAIDFGDYYDSAFLASGPAAFHEREAGADGRGTSTPWPKESLRLELPGGRSGIWLATVTLANGQPDDALKLTALAANGRALSIARRTPRSFVALIPPEIAAAPALSLELIPALTDGEVAAPGTVAAVELTPARTYRWSSGASEIRLPGLGRGDWQITLGAIVAHPDGRPVNATLSANGVALARLPERGEPRRLRLLVPAALVPAGDLTLRISADTYNDPRPLGVLVDSLRVAPAGATPWLPPWWSVTCALTIALGLYLALRVITGMRWPSAAAALAVALGVALALAVARYPTAIMLPRLALLSLWSLALLAALGPLVAWIFRRAGVPLSARALAALLLIFFVGYWLKSSGMLYPYFVARDVSWHMARVEMILNGQLPLLYGTNSPLNESTMPVAEWGANRPVIPYSPWFHMFAASFALLPLPLVLAANLFSALVDCSRVFLIALLGRGAGMGERSAVLAVLAYAVTPATFLLHSWGNIPTTFGMWWTLVCTVYIVVAYRRLDRPGPWLALTLLLAITMLMYTVMGVFMGVFLLLLIGLLLFASPRGERRPVWALALAAAAAAALAILVYYGQYIPLFVERTIPYFTQAAAPSGIAEVKRDPFPIYLANYLPRMAYFNDRGGGYGLLLALPLGLLGWYWLRGRPIRQALLAWLGVALLFLVAGSRVSMVDKHVFYLIPALALGIGAVFGRLWQRGWAARVVTVALYAFTLAAALNLWMYRILTVRQ
jgi:hypothetical protein